MKAASSVFFCSSPVFLCPMSLRMMSRSFSKLARTVRLSFATAALLKSDQCFMTSSDPQVRKLGENSM